MVEEDIGEVGSLLNEIETLNVERRYLCRTIAEQAVEKARQHPFENGYLLMDPVWHIGVVGIVASRIVEEFGIPALVCGVSGGVVKGSGRSLDSVNIKHILDSCSELFEIYGGHEMAVGATLKNQFLPVAAQRFDEACRRYYEVHGRPKFVQYYDIDIHPRSVKASVARMLLQTLFPYCEQYNPEPIFKLWNVKIVNCSIMNRADWRKVTYTVEAQDGYRLPMKFVTFDEQYGAGLEGKNVDILFKFPQLSNTKWDPTLELIDTIQL
jgi:single-stranded-DNA-specific exonuclease